MPAVKFQPVILRMGSHQINRLMLLVIRSDVEHLHTPTFGEGFQPKFFYAGGLALLEDCGNGFLQLTLANEIRSADEQFPAPLFLRHFAKIFLAARAPPLSLQFTDPIIPLPAE